MKTLYLLRHAKSSWDEPSLADVERPLSRRGRKAAKALRRLLDRRGIRPALILCSAARRTRETYEAIAPALEGVGVGFEGTLYEAAEDELLSRLRDLPDAADSVMLIGHNPGLERLTWLLIGPAADGSPHAALRRKFPTAALAVLEFPDRSWASLSRATCRLVDFVRPDDDR